MEYYSAIQRYEVLIKCYIMDDFENINEMFMKKT